MKNIMVCVTLQNTCQKLIDHAVSIKESDDKLFVLHVAKNIEAVDKGAILEFLYSVSHSAGADMTVLYSENALKAVLDFVKDNEINTIILGKPENVYKDNGFISSLENSLDENIEIILLDKKE